jgi:pimeloyl-ACP methyl ester carboxylesterase
MDYEQARAGGGCIDHVIYVHGLWMNGTDGLILRRRLARDSGMKTHVFHYPSISGSMSDSATRLADFARKLRAERVHFVGHSLGGLVIYRALERQAGLPPGRVVFLGTPALGSRAALGVKKRLSFASGILGRCIAEELFTEQARRWELGRDLGVIAGTRRVGLGQYFTRFDEDCDGTVCVSETRIPGATDFLTERVGHMGLLLSKQVAQQTGTFLTQGRFIR